MIPLHVRLDCSHPPRSVRHGRLVKFKKILSLRMAKKRSHDAYAADDTPPSSTLSHLNTTYPSKVHHAPIPSYDSSRPIPSPPKQSQPSYHSMASRSASAFPALPALAPGNLSTAPFTHPSIASSKYTASYTPGRQLNYERLEFLGDAYIEIIATRIIYARFPHLVTGKQARLRETLVRNSTLAGFATKYSFGSRIVGDRGILGEGAVVGGYVHGTQLGPGMGQGQGPKAKTWEKTLADVFEAYVAAVVLSDVVDGFKTVESWLEELWAPLLLHPEGSTNIQSAAGMTGSGSGSEAFRSISNGTGVTSTSNGVDATAADLDGIDTNWKDKLNALVGTRAVTIKYKDEELPTPTHAPRSKDEAFHAGQMRKVAVYVTLDEEEGGTDIKRDPGIKQEHDEESPARKKPRPEQAKNEAIKDVSIGVGTGKGRKEAGMLAARDAVNSGNEVVQQLMERKKARAAAIANANANGAAA